jgi:hypothetical protein
MASAQGGALSTQEAAAAAVAAVPALTGARAAVAELLALGGLPQALGNEETLKLTDIDAPRDGGGSGGGIVAIRTPFRAAEAAQAALAACGTAVAHLWEIRTGERQVVSVDLQRAAASLLSFQLAHTAAASDDVLVATTLMTAPPGSLTGCVDPRANTRQRLRLPGIFRCKDGRYIHLHSSFDHHQVLEVLGVSSSDDAVLQGGDSLTSLLGARCAEWDALDLEEAFASHGPRGIVSGHNSSQVQPVLQPPHTRTNRA